LFVIWHNDIFLNDLFAHLWR